MAPLAFRPWARLASATMSSLPPDERVILLDPFPRRLERIFDEPTRRRLERLGRVVWHDGSPAAAEHIERHLPHTIALIGQSALDKARLDRAPHLRAVFNVESNFLPNLDYAECHRRGIPVLSTAPVYARPVAELALAMAISLARRMHEADAALRVGKEFKGDNHDSFLLHGKPLALVGLGNLGRALLPLLRPFSRELLVHDPWIHPSVLRELDVIPATLDECFARARVVFLLAANTSENTGRIGARHFASMVKGSVVVLAEPGGPGEFPGAARGGGERAHSRRHRRVAGGTRAAGRAGPAHAEHPDPGASRRQRAGDPAAHRADRRRRPREHPRRPAAAALPARRARNGVEAAQHPRRRLVAQRHAPP
jgi:hypothetical protein